MLYGLMAALLLVVAVFAAVDLVPMARAWTGRIHIGRYAAVERWAEAIVRKGVRWLNRTPKIKVTDNTRLILLDMLKGNYARSAIQHWQEAALLLGLAERVRLAGADPELLAQADRYLAATFDSDGQWREKPRQVDGAILAYAVMTWPAADPDRYRPAWDHVRQMIEQHLGDDGTVLYRQAMKDYRYVDTIGFVCPFLVVYGLRYGRPDCLRLAVKQIREYEKHGMLQEPFLPFHAYDVRRRLPLGLYGWGRGLGWYAIGLIDAWAALPDGHEAKEELERSVVRFARSAIACQQPQGNWNWTATRPEARADSSATAALAWFLVQAAKIGEIAAPATEAAGKAIRYLMSVTRRDGAVDFSQGDTKDIGVYSMLFDILPFTQGLSIRAVHAYQRLQKDRGRP